MLREMLAFFTLSCVDLNASQDELQELVNWSLDNDLLHSSFYFSQSF